MNLDEILARYPDNDPIDNDVRALVEEVRCLKLQVDELRTVVRAFMHASDLAKDITFAPVYKYAEKLLAGVTEKQVGTSPTDRPCCVEAYARGHAVGSAQRGPSCSPSCGCNCHEEG